MKAKFFLIGLLVFITSLAMSQTTSIVIPQGNYVYDQCKLNQQIAIPVYLSGTNAPSDTLFKLKIEFGDGQSDSAYVKIPYTNGPVFQHVDFSHLFIAAGQYIITYSLSDTNGMVASTNDYVNLYNNCDTIKGRLFNDKNSNCVFDGVDSPIANAQVEISSKSPNVSTFYAKQTYSDSLGMYWFYVHKNDTNIITTSAYLFNNSAVIPCLTNGQVTAVAPSVNQDFAFNKGMFLLNLYTSDSTHNFSYFETCDNNYSININLTTLLPDFNLQDTTIAKIYFGDGTDTTFNSYIYEYYGEIRGSAFASHIYKHPGTYSAKIVYYAQGGYRDSLILKNYVTIGDTCGNIAGHVYNDINANCKYDAGDLPLANIPVHLIHNGNIINVTISDKEGKYAFEGITGNNYEVEIYDPVQDFGFSTVCPASGKYTLSAIPSTNNDFGLTCSASHDLVGTVSGWRFKPGFDGYLYIDAANAACDTVNGTFKLVLPPAVSFVNAYPIPAAISGDTIIWNKAAMNNQQNAFHAVVTVNTHANASLGDQVCTKLIIGPIANDRNPSNNVLNACFDIRGSWDPNLKEVEPKGSGTQGYIEPNQLMTYNVHFQNTGNDTAYNVVILDTLSKNLDYSTFRIIASSDSVTGKISEGGALKLDFHNIYLVDSTANLKGSNGYVTYTIAQKTDLPEGATIENTASIYFDFNATVVTNTVLNTIKRAVVGIKELPGSGIKIYPNPANDQLNISFIQAEATADIMVMDLLGNLISLTKTSNGKAELNTVNIANGTYMLVVKDGNAVKREKLVILH